MRKCSVCGKVFDDTVRYCDFCGADLLAQRTGTRMVDGNNGNGKGSRSLKIPSTGGLLIALLAALIVLAVTGTIVFTANRRQSRSNARSTQAEMTVQTDQTAEVSAVSPEAEQSVNKESIGTEQTDTAKQYVNSAPRNVSGSQSSGGITYVSPYSNTGNSGNIQYYRPETNTGILPGGSAGGSSQENQAPSAGTEQGTEESSTSTAPAEAESGIIFPDSSSRLLTTEEIRALTDEELRMAINELYARHGYIFRTQSLQDFYSGFSWYVPRDSNMERVASTFNATEDANCKAMVAERERRN